MEVRGILRQRDGTEMEVQGILGEKDGTEMENADEDISDWRQLFFRKGLCHADGEGA